MNEKGRIFVAFPAKNLHFLLAKVAGGFGKLFIMVYWLAQSIMWWKKRKKGKGGRFCGLLSKTRLKSQMHFWVLHISDALSDVVKRKTSCLTDEKEGCLVKYESIHSYTIVVEKTFCPLKFQMMPFVTPLPTFRMVYFNS